VIELLAQLRHSLRRIEIGLAQYVEAGKSRQMTASLQADIASLKAVRENIATIRYQVPPTDQVSLGKIAALTEKSAGEIQTLASLRASLRWDYADFVFKQQVLPPAMEILETIRKWPGA